MHKTEFTTITLHHLLFPGTFGRVIFIPTVFGAVFLDSLMTGNRTYFIPPFCVLNVVVIAGTMVNVMGLTQTEDAVLQQSTENAENCEHRHAAAGYMSAWMR